MIGRALGVVRVIRKQVWLAPLVWLVCSTSLWSQQIESPKQLYVGAQRCGRTGCHSNGEAKLSDLVLGDEFKHWEQKDLKHRHAFDVLDPKAEKNETTRRMAELLPGINFQSDSRCLACHAVDNRAAVHSKEGPTIVEEKTLEDLIRDRVALGVSCEACHGPASAWLKNHDSWNNEKFREWSADKKNTPADQLPAKLAKVKSELVAQKAVAGMVDVRDPVVRAKLCLSCHQGNIGEGKFVTHEMFAAGHPPLPPFEIESSIDRMHFHWQPTEEKAVQIQEFLDFHRPDRARSVVLEGLIAQRQALQMIADQAAASAKPNRVAAHAGMTDFALYSCSACHHELTYPSPRQRRGYGDRSPGRPALSDWSARFAKVSLLAIAADGNSDTELLNDVRAPLDGLIARRSLRISPQAASGAALEGIKKLDGQIDLFRIKTAAGGMNESAAVRALRNLCRSGEPSADVDSARHLVAGLQMIVLDLRATAKAKAGTAAVKSEPNLDKALADLAAEANRDGVDYDPERFAKLLAGFAAALAAR